MNKKLRKTGNTPSSAGSAKLYRVTSTSDRRYYAQTGSMEVDVVGDEEHDFGQFLSEYIPDIALIAAEIA